LKESTTAVASDQIQQRREHLQLLRQKCDPYSQQVKVTHSVQDVLERYTPLKGEEHSEDRVQIAGRMMALRLHGKAAFGDLVDLSGRVQVYFKLDKLGEEQWGIFELLDLGDVLGIEGSPFRTKRGELTVLVERFQPLAKCLYPLPEKWHGLKDVEVRYRQRYLDLIVNPEVRKIFLLRSRLVSLVRRFLDERNFHEMETPVMTGLVGGAEARPFITHHHALDIDLYLRIATELYLKRLIVGGLERVYEIGRIFRNEGVSTRHNPEFTMLEVYEAYSDYEGMMKLTEDLLVFLSDDLLKTRQVPYQGKTISFEPPFKKLSYAGALMEYGKIELQEIRDFEKAKDIARRLRIPVDGKTHGGQLLDKIFEVVVEPHLVQPTFIIDYPIEISPLAKRKPEDPTLTYRFELFGMHMELANAFSELNDPDDQRQRFLKQLDLREAGDEEAHMMDEDFLRALEFGMPPTGGLGIGIDRLCMLFSDSASIREVVLFPLLKPKKDESLEIEE